MEGYKGVENMSAETMERDRIIDSLHGTFERQKNLYQPKPETFIAIGGFSEETIKKEMGYVQKLKDQWESTNGEYEQKNKKISDVFEGIMVDQFCGEWMANKAEAFFTAEADDYLRKIDCIIEFQPENELESAEHLGLGLDVTFSSDYSTLQAKLDDIWKHDVMRNKQVEVKYVDTGKYKGSLDVCRVVLAAEKQTVYELAKLYKHDREKLNNHEFLANVISQIKYQLESYYRYAQSNGASGDYLRAVTKTLSTFYRIYSEKEEFIASHVDEVMQSATFKRIQSYCDQKIGQ